MVRTAWLRRVSTYGIAATMSLFGLTGMASAQTITNTGPDSTNTITSNTTSNCTVTNNNDLSAQSSNSQTAVSGDAEVSGNTTAGLPWTGWSALDPAAAQAAGQSYASWQSGITSWVSQRASGNGWNSSNMNLSWTPSGSSWNSFDPVSWQANGQSFGNWYNAMEAYLNSNSSHWLLTWPPSANGNSLGGATTSNATNNYNANFSININNAASAVAGVDACGRSNFTPPPSTGGMGGGSTVPSAMHQSSAPHISSGGSGGGGGYSSYAPTGSSYHAPTAAAKSTPKPSTPPPSGGSGGGGVPPAAPVSSISKTGPGSTNTISSSHTSNYQATNNNTVSVSSVNTQCASSGDATVAGNTTTGSGGSGSASNTSGSSFGTKLTN